jgi:3-methylcrotonyl-CoA carboxylase alpha subunit
MLAKLIHHAPDRTQAIAGLRAMAAQVECWPVKTNAAFLVKALGMPMWSRARSTPA